MRLAPGKDFIPIQSVPSSSSPLLQLQELFTVAGRTAAFGRVKPALGAGLLSFRQCGIPFGANSAMSKVRIVGCLALGTSPLLLNYGHGLTPSSLGITLSFGKNSIKSIQCEKQLYRADLPRVNLPHSKLDFAGHRHVSGSEGRREWILL